MDSSSPNPGCQTSGSLPEEERPRAGESNLRPILQEAHRAYRDSGGSMNAFIASLLTSDAFLCRTVERKAVTHASTN